MTNVSFLSSKTQIASQDSGNYFSTGSVFRSINQNKKERKYVTLENKAVKLQASHVACVYFASFCTLACKCSPWSCRRSQTRVAESISVSLQTASVR